jgi:hypothetical protein
MACDVPPRSPSSSSVSSPRVVDVKDYVSGCVIRSVVVDDNSSGSSRMGTELLSVYFEDSSVRAGLAKMAVPKALWPYIQKYDAALRQFADTRASPRSVLASVPIIVRGDRREDDDDDDLASVSSCDNELDKVYAQLKKKKKRRRRYFGGRQQSGGGRRSSLASAYSIGGGGNVNNTRWAKRIAVAAAFKMLHVILMD